MPLIELALEGRYEYLRAINGIPEPEDQTPRLAIDGPDGLGSYLRRRAKG